MLQLNGIEKQLKGNLYFNHSLKKLNAWKTGGPGECCYFPESVNELSLFLRHCAPGTAITFLGLGSNVLVRDEGVPGVIVVLRNNFANIQCIDETTVYVTAGVTCRKFVHYCVDQKLSGIEFLAGIPGTVGGALAMNAGALGQETWDFVLAVETIDVQGKIHRRQANAFQTSYRTVRRKHASHKEWFVAGYFCLKQDVEKAGQGTVLGMLKKRNESQPVSQFNCGCVFKNPGNEHAARLIEQCGLKGCVVGDAQVSEKHANFIINRGNASSLDIEMLIKHVQAVVHEKTGIQLELEVKIIGGRYEQ